MEGGNGGQEGSFSGSVSLQQAVQKSTSSNRVGRRVSGNGDETLQIERNGTTGRTLMLALVVMPEIDRAGRPSYVGFLFRCYSDPISDDLRFYTTFNAVLALANTALRASGYRATNQQGHHTRTLETLEYTIGTDAKLIRKLLAFSKKRNVASYDSAGSISNQELKDILTTAEELRYTTESWLRTSHPELL